MGKRIAVTVAGDGTELAVVSISSSPFVEEAGKADRRDPLRAGWWDKEIRE
jgi:hypothetical protein